MRKINFITVSLLLIMMMTCMMFTSCSDSGQNDRETENSSSENSLTTDAALPEESETSMEEETGSPESDVPTKPTKESDEKPASLTDALFIGDSRTVGIMEYAGLNDANFFCDTGMSVFNVRKNRVSVPAIGKVTLDELLSNRKYGKIYIMLGINELGYDFKSIVNQYRELIEFVESRQPNAAVFLQANLHVSKKRSDSDKVINNSAINKLNSELSKMADNKKVFYLDANALFDDSNGNLDAAKTQDQAHLLGKYYSEWGEWIRKESARYVKGE